MTLQRPIGLDIAAGHLFRLAVPLQSLDLPGIGFLVIRDEIGDGAAEDHYALQVAAFVAARLKGPKLVAEVDLYRADPYLIARALTSLDILSGGRAGLLALGAPKGVADIGFATAETGADFIAEFVEVLDKLWNSWGETALARRWDENLYLDRAELRETNHLGAHFAVRGPLPTPRAVQDRAMILAADHPAHAGIAATADGVIARRAPATGHWFQQLDRPEDLSPDAAAGVVAVPPDLDDWDALRAFARQPAPTGAAHV